MVLRTYFSDVFNVSEGDIEKHGAFNIALATDLPLFIDPFLLFNSEKLEYIQLHDEIITYLRFLKTKSESVVISVGLLRSWYYFSEVKQNWLGFCKAGNAGRGLGNKFAKALDKNLVLVFKNFGEEQITRGSHLEKLCLIGSGIGRDMISDFTTNLIKDYLLKYTETFAQNHINGKFIKKISVERAFFDYKYERWMPKLYHLPYYNNDYVILTPKDLLTKDETWLNYADMLSRFEDIPNTIENDALRAQVNNYFQSMLSGTIKPSKEDKEQAIESVIHKYPQLIDYYIKIKEELGDQAISTSNTKVDESYLLYIKQFGELISLLYETPFYTLLGTTSTETREKIEYFKDVVENKGAYRIFYINGEPIRKEADIHILFRLTWHQTISDVSREVNDGGGPADFKISRGASDKTLVEFKLASNTQLKRSLVKQIEVYKKASDAEKGYKVIVYFTEKELQRVQKILKELDLTSDPYIFLVDARDDNKPTGSKA